MEKYQERVIEELKDMEEKANKLQNFLNNNGSVTLLTFEEQDLLTSQLHTMWIYMSFLRRSINLFKE